MRAARQRRNSSCLWAARLIPHPWDYFAQEAGDPAWNYESVLGIYRRIEDWHGPADPSRRGSGGPVFVQPAPDPNPIAPALLEGARAVGISTLTVLTAACWKGTAVAH
jgi:choline dehydrogenase